MDFQSLFERALPYHDFLARYGTEAHRERWQAVYERIRLTEAQRQLLSGAQRRIHLLCLAGTWCGDCATQGPILQRIAEAGPEIRLRFADRDEESPLQDALRLNAGRRIPVVLFLSEDFEECARYGDRTLAVYRRMAHERLGPSCPTGILPPGPDQLADVTADWLREFERVSLMLRLSPRLRALHGD
ncbi:MAG: thioredoxin family protein [Anaerolineales bacterium]